jgi:hypothetical protein
MRFFLLFLVCTITLCTSSTLLMSQGCECQPPNPLCSWDECLPSVGVLSGVLNIPIATSTGDCVVTVIWCSRNLTGTACARAGYGSTCEYKLSKICFPAECAISCEDNEMNLLLLSLVKSVALLNPAGHFVPTSNQWSDPNYRAAWRLGFPACFLCETDPITGCMSVVGCGASTCFEWNEAYECRAPNCPSATPLCTAPCPGPAVTLKKLDKGKTVGECNGPHTTCILCGH